MKRHQNRTPCEDEGLELCTHEPQGAKDNCRSSKSQARARADPLQVQRKHGPDYTLTSDLKNKGSMSLFLQAIWIVMVCYKRPVKVNKICRHFLQYNLMCMYIEVLKFWIESVFPFTKTTEFLRMF